MKLHSKKDIYYLYRFLLISSIPLILFGLLKNGILLYKETNSLFIILKPLIFLGINISLGFISDIVFYKKIKLNKYILYLTILFMVTSINTPLWLYLLEDLLLIFLLRFDKQIINKVAIVCVIGIIGNFLLHNNSYGNAIETSGKYVFSFIDMIFFRQEGGIATTNFILVIILLISLLFNVLYKRNIALFGILSYSLFWGLLSIIYEPLACIKILINSTVLFEIIMIAPLNEYSPYTPKGEIVYGILLGIVGGILCNYTTIYLGIPLAILLLTPMRLLFDKNKLFS